MDDAALGGAVAAVIRAWSRWVVEQRRRERAVELEDRVDGYRIVAGGQTGRDGAWVITDAASGELLAAGVGLDAYEAAWQDHWRHVDTLGGDADVDEPVLDVGLPAGLVTAIADWVVGHPDQAGVLLD